jgi:putative tricarboxylic transport membrane protein
LNVNIVATVEDKKKIEGGAMGEGTKSSPKGGGFQFKVRGPQDFFGGLALIALAIIALLASSDLPGQQGFVFGPGTAPRLVATLLAIVGALVALNGLFVDGPKLAAYAFRGPAFVLSAILIFAIMMGGIDFRPLGIPLAIPPLGLVLSTFTAFIVSIMGSKEMRWIESLLAGAAMTAFCIGLFSFLLQLPFKLWPGQ